jgi:hypothetical protein
MAQGKERVTLLARDQSDKTTLAVLRWDESRGGFYGAARASGTITKVRILVDDQHLATFTPEDVYALRQDEDDLLIETVDEAVRDMIWRVSGGVVGLPLHMRVLAEAFGIASVRPAPPADTLEDYERLDEELAKLDQP